MTFFVSSYLFKLQFCKKNHPKLTKFQQKTVKRPNQKCFSSHWTLSSHPTSVCIIWKEFSWRKMKVDSSRLRCCWVQKNSIKVKWSQIFYLRFLKIQWLTYTHGTRNKRLRNKNIFLDDRFSIRKIVWTHNKEKTRIRNDCERKDCSNSVKL